MLNTNLSLSTNDSFIKKLINLKVKKYLDLITKEEYKNVTIDLILTNDQYSDYIEQLSKIATEVIIKRIKAADEISETRVLLNEMVKIYDEDDYIEMNCDAILINKECMEIISVLPLDNNYSYAFSNFEIKLLAVGAIDKYLTSLSGTLLKLTIIQPNLNFVSSYEVDILDFLHEVEFRYLNL